MNGPSVHRISLESGVEARRTTSSRSVCTNSLTAEVAGAGSTGSTASDALSARRLLQGGSSSSGCPSCLHGGGLGEEVGGGLFCLHGGSGAGGEVDRRFEPDGGAPSGGVICCGSPGGWGGPRATWIRYRSGGSAVGGTRTAILSVRFSPCRSLM